MPSNLSKIFADFLIRQRWLLLVIGFVMTATSIMFAPTLDFDRSIENMFSADDEFLGPYRKLNEVFGGSEAVAVVFREPTLFEEEGPGMERVRSLSGELSQVDGIADVISVSTLDDLLTQFFKKELTSKGYPSDAFRDLFAELTHSTDGKTAAIICLLKDRSASGIPRHQIVADIREIIAELPPNHPEVMVTGEPVMVVDGFRLIENDGEMLKWSSALLLALVILACFRSVRWVVIPLAIVQFSLLTTQAILAWTGLKLSMVSSMFAAIVTVIGVATVVHVIVRFREARGRKLSPEASLRDSLVRLIAPVTWACLTDAAGFTALGFSTIGPIQDFGLMMAIGSCMVLLACALLIPGLALFPLPKFVRVLDVEPQHSWTEVVLDQSLQGPLYWIRKAPWSLAAIMIGLTVFTSFGLMRTEVESDFTKNFQEQSEIVQSYKFVESNLGGAGVWDLMLPASKELTWAEIQRIDALEKSLRRDVVVVVDSQGRVGPKPQSKENVSTVSSDEANEEATEPSASSNDAEVQGLTKVVSIVDAIKAAVPPIAFSALSFAPESRRNDVLGTALNQMHDRMPGMMNSLHAPDPDNPNQWYVRVMLRSHERQPAPVKKEIIRQVHAIVDQAYPVTESDPAQTGSTPTEQEAAGRVSGFYVMLTHLVDQVLRDQWKTFGIATALIALMMMIAFRNPFLAIAGLLPNALTIVWLLGTLGWLGIKINMGTAMIAAVSMGLSIDSSIHYITVYRRARKASLSVHDALDNAQERVGQALVYATLALVFGFAILCLSDFIPTVYFGLLVSISMLGGMLGNLLVLPLCLHAFGGRFTRSLKKSSRESDPVYGSKVDPL